MDKKQENNQKGTTEGVSSKHPHHPGGDHDHDSSKHPHHLGGEHDHDASKHPHPPSSDHNPDLSWHPHHHGGGHDHDSSKHPHHTGGEHDHDSSKHPHHHGGGHDHDSSKHPHHTGGDHNPDLGWHPQPIDSDQSSKLQNLKKKLHINREQFHALRRIPHIDHCKRLTFHHNDPDPEWEVNEIIVEFDGTELDDGSNHVPETGTYEWVNHAWVLNREYDVL